MNFKRRLKRKSKYWNNDVRSEEYVPQRMGEDGNLVVTLEKDGIEEEFPVAYLVAQAFVPNPNKLPYVRHKDGNKLNNRADNLEWSATKED